VNLSGLGGYSTIFPSSLVFTPDNWKVGVEVTVSAAAPTANRPICASGNRYCDDIQSRVETISHSVSSLDADYDLLSVSDVEVFVDVKYDTYDPPKVSVARFNNLLNAITVTFDKDTDRAGESGSFSCSEILALTTAQIKTMFGSGAKCSFTSNSVLKVTFGSKATVVPYNVIAINDLVLQSSAIGASLYTVNETIVVKQPIVPTVPAVTLSPSSYSVGVCDDLTLDASSSTGSGGRSMVYNFSVSPSSGHLVANVSEVLAVVNAKNNGYGSYRVSIPSEVMNKGSKMVFKLTITNFLGYSSTSTVTVNKLEVPAPVVAIQGASSRTMYRSDALTLRANAVSFVCLLFPPFLSLYAFYSQSEICDHIFITDTSYINKIGDPDHDVFGLLPIECEDEFRMV
jgi:hypothetical protein